MNALRNDTGTLLPVPDAAANAASASGPGIDMETLDGFLAAVDAVFERAAASGRIHRPASVQRAYAHQVARAIHAGRSAADRPAVTTAAQQQALAGRGLKAGLGTPGAVGVQVLLDAETGTGKTFGYLVPLLLESVRVAGHGRCAVSTYTIALQRQIMDPAKLDPILDAVAAITGFRASVRLRVGMSNFVDPERYARRALRADLAHPKLTPRETELRDALRQWVAASVADPSATGLLAEFAEVNDGEWPAEIAPHDICVNARSTRPLPEDGKDHGHPERYGDGRMFYLRHGATAAASNVVVTNHASMLYDTLIEGGILGLGGEPIVAAVFDEADLLDSAAASIDSGDVALEALRRNLLDLQDAARTAHGIFGDGLTAQALVPDVQACGALIDAANALSAPADVIDRAGADPDVTTAMLDDPGLPVERVAEFLEAIAALGEKTEPLVKYASDRAVAGALPPDLEDAVRRLGAIKAFGSTAVKQLQVQAGQGPAHASHRAITDQTPLLAVRWSPKRHNPSLVWNRLYPARLLGWRWNVAKDGTAPVLRTAVFTSATLAVRSFVKNRETYDFKRIRSQLGLLDGRNEGLALSRTFAPEVFGTASFLYADADAPRPFARTDPDADHADDQPKIPQPEWVRYVSQMLQRALALHPHTRALVLPSSFVMGEALAERFIEDKIPHVILRASGTRPNAKSMYDAVTAHDDSIYVAAGAWSGFEMMESRDGRARNAFGIIVAANVPFFPPRKVRERGLERVLVAHGRKRELATGIVHRESGDHAQMMLRQAFGRGIRGANDVACFVVCDPRFPAPACLQLGATRNARYANLAAAIPARFREDGDGSTIDAGEVVRYVKPPTKRKVKRGATASELAAPAGQL